jgi:hypothetical protein
MQLLWPPPGERRGTIMVTFFDLKECLLGARESTLNAATLGRCGVGWIHLWEEVIRRLRMS